MLYSTRNPKEAEKFVELLPINEYEKEEMRSYFPIISNYMAELVKSRGLNSKGGEKWFSQRILSLVQQTEEIISRFFVGSADSPIELAKKFLLIQSAVVSETLALGKECGVSPETLNGLERYGEFMNSLVSKYSGIDELLNLNDENGRQHKA